MARGLAAAPRVIAVSGIAAALGSAMPGGALGGLNAGVVTALGFRRHQFFGGDAERRRCGGTEVKWCAFANRAANGGSSGAPSEAVGPWA